jgi:hypothetical protein
MNTDYVEYSKVTSISHQPTGMVQTQGVAKS